MAVQWKEGTILSNQNHSHPYIFPKSSDGGDGKVTLYRHPLCAYPNTFYICLVRRDGDFQLLIVNE